ncbi:MAG: hypothetical protein V4813_18725 [Gemmatimonadota bacterium]
MIRRSIRHLSAAATMLAIGAPLSAQPAPAPASGWNALLGCWSTSSAGAVGPTVCVVPTDSAHRAEFLTVDADSVVARVMVDASGTPRPFRRGACAGFEAAWWSTDAERLYTRAEYRCHRGVVQRSDAMLSRSQADAFSHIERATTSDSAPARVVNFIARTDVDSMPAEVRLRLAQVDAAATSSWPTGTMLRASRSAIVDAMTNVDPVVVQAWLRDRGQGATLPVLSAAQVQSAAAERQQSIWPRYARLHVDRKGMATVASLSSRLPVSQADTGIPFESPNPRDWNPNFFGGGSSLSPAGALPFGRP